MGRESAREVRKAQRYFQCALQEEIWQKVQVAGANIEVLLESGRVKEAWYHLEWWYHQGRERQSQLTRERLNQVLEDMAKL